MQTSCINSTKYILSYTYCNDPSVNGPFCIATAEKGVNNDASTGEIPAPK